MWVAIGCLNLERHGTFNLEYMALGMIALFVPRLLSASILFAMISTDVFYGVCQSYVLSPGECLRYISSIGDLSYGRIFAATAVTILALLVAATAALLPPVRTGKRERFALAGCLFATALALFVADVETIARNTGRIPTFRFEAPSDSVKLSSFSELRLARLPALGLARTSLYYAEHLTFSKIRSNAAGESVPSAAGFALHVAASDVLNKSDEATNVVLIIAESWGLAGDPALRSALIEPYLAPHLLSKYQVFQGTVPFYGSTIAGEARELCASKMGYFLLSASSRELKDCLPGVLATHGYDAIAVHGNAGHMFDRTDWYSAIGFQERWFREQLRQQGLPSCVGAATGICDASIAEWIGNRLQRLDQKPTFLYWVTLNSHLPVPTPVPITTAVPCSVLPLPTPQPALCSWTQLVLNLHRSVSQLAMSKLARPTLFIVVGDHAPPFGDLALRQEFSDSVVPYIILAPRSLGDRDRPRPGPAAELIMMKKTPSKSK